MKNLFFGTFFGWQVGLTCAGSVLNLLDFADYSIYIYIVPIAALLLFAALVSGLVAIKGQSTKSRVIAMVCMLVCAIQLPDVVFRRLPAALSNPNIAQQQALRAKTFEEAIEKIRK
ncbi:MAG TPA: hypothetical protein V6C97_08505 [Oculatellaceae cyanobacterium]